MDELARLLSVERRLLELLLFKLVEGRHLLAAGEARFLPYAAAEVERAMERVQDAELRRSMVVSDLARELEIPEDSHTLSALACDSVGPYPTIFSDHRFRFLELSAEIEDVTGQNRRLAERGAHDVEQLTKAADNAESMMDLQMAESGYQAVGAVSRLSMPSLLDFLR